MLEKLVRFFSTRHLLNNFIVIFVFIGALIAWEVIGKEELPNIDMGFVQISATYSGASPEVVEKLITKKIEDELTGIDGIYQVTSTSSVGSSSITVEISNDYPDKDAAVMEIRTAIDRADLPSDMLDDPIIKVFKTSNKAVIDVAVYMQHRDLLSIEDRKGFQKYVYSLKNQLENLSTISDVSESGYLDEEIHIQLDPKKLNRFTIPIAKVKSQLSGHNILQPAGNLKDIHNSKVSVLDELTTVDKINEVPIRSTFDSPIIRVKDIAKVVDTFKSGTSIFKINGHEGVIFSLTKSSSADILTAVSDVKQLVKKYNDNFSEKGNIKVVALDDESKSIKSRLSLIKTNGLFGFILILIILFLFLDFQSGLWVAMGIPFTFCFTLICVYLLGYTINNVTLSAFIIVMGIVVDDAIVIAENIHRYKSQGLSDEEASEKGTVSVFLPIFASITTTCAAFLPLMFFSGRLANFIKYIPPVVFLMLGASLFESTLILPAHMKLKIPNWVKGVFTLGLFYIFNSKIKKQIQKGTYVKRPDRFLKAEKFYEKKLKWFLRYKWWVFLVFILFLFGSCKMAKSMKFVMFPNEEATEVHLVATAPVGTNKETTAKMAKAVEDVFIPYLKTELSGFRTSVAKSRRGSAAYENELFMKIELRDREERTKSLKQLLAEWNKKIKKIKGFKRIEFMRRRFGQSSGSAIEVLIQASERKDRMGAARMLSDIMKKDKRLTGVEIEKPVLSPEYKITLKRALITRLSVEPTSVSLAFRALLDGSVVYNFLRGDEEVNVRVTTGDPDKRKINQILDFSVANTSSKLVPIRSLVNLKKEDTPNSIRRKNFRRVTYVYANPAGDKKKQAAPINIANEYEKKVFPLIWKKYPSVSLSFDGEVKDTRESQSSFGMATSLVLFLVFAIMALQFDSLIRPLMIMLSIPFGVAGVVIIFYLHTITAFGLFTGIGILGLCGVIVNDAIVLVDKLDQNINDLHGAHHNEKIASISATRLKAVVLTTLTTVAGVMPTAYGIAGYDSLLSQMMLALSWGLIFATLITLILIPCLYSALMDFSDFRDRKKARKLEKKGDFAEKMS